jgi:hypothetical protein
MKDVPALSILDGRLIVDSNLVRESGSVYRAWIDNAHGRTTDQDRREVP